MKPEKNNSYVKWGLTAFCVVAASVFLWVILRNLPGFFGVLQDLGKVLSPLIYGVVFAFLMNPLVNFADKRLAPLFRKQKKKASSAKKLSRALSILFALVFAILILYAFFSMLLPQLYISIKGIVDSIPTYYASIEKWVENILENNPDIRTYADSALNKAYDYINNWAQTSLVSDMQKVVTTLTSSVYAVIKTLANILIGLVASVYMLWSKDIFQAQAKKMVVAIFHPHAADNLLRVGRETYKVFNGFVIGKIIDSAIIGVLCYLGMVIMKLPYPALIATIVGVTNVIPFFGPIIGAAPSALLILLVNPLQAFYFIIFIIILQQIDGNVIGPKILGNTVGISGFWVLTSITLATSLFGFAGMILGVPVFAIIYMLVSDAVSASLRKKSQPTATADYFDIKQVSDLDKKREAPQEETPVQTEQKENDMKQ
jgi:predicted PurR-regulated permease PerM